MYNSADILDDPENRDWFDNEEGVVVDGLIVDDEENDNISETEEFSQLLKLSIYHSENCTEFEKILEESSLKDLEERDQKGRTVFMNLAMFSCDKCAAKLLKKCKHFNVNQTDDDKCTALMAASKSGNPDMVKLILSFGPDVTLKDASKNTALHHSVSASNDKFSIDCVHLLLQSYCNANALNDSKTTPLLQAIFSGNTEAVPLLINYGAKPMITDEHGLLPIVEAAYGGDVDTVKILIDNGVPINSRDSSGETALLVASREGHTECVRFLLENNADVSVVNDSGSTALMLAHESGYTDVTRLLHAAGCPPQRNPFADPGDIKLWDICCYVIRSRLVDSNLHKNLLCLIPQLSFPQRVKNSLLENVTL